MTLVIDALARAARQCSVEQPSSWLSATEPEHVEVRDDFLLETVEDILDRSEVPEPISQQTTIAGTGVERYALPADFYRLHRDDFAVYETTTVRRRCTPVTNDGAWTHLKEVGSAGAERYFRVVGYDGNYEIDFFQTPGSGISVTVHYVSKNWMAASNGVAGSALTAATDVLLMPRRLVEAGIVYRFRERKGLDFTAKKMEYEFQLDRFNNYSRNRTIIGFGGRPMVHPWDIPVPDFIPSGS